MATPQTVLVTATVRNPDGTPYSGPVIFTQPVHLRHADGTMIMPGRTTAAIVAGALSIGVYPVDDPDWTPLNWAYEVKLRRGSTWVKYAFQPGIADLTETLNDIIPVDTVLTPGETYALSNHTHADLVTDAELAAALAALGGGTVTSVAGKTGVVTLVPGDVGLGNVNNTSDANKPVSTAQAAADALKFDKTGGPVTGDLSVSGYTALHGGEFNGDLVVTGYTSLQGISLGGDLVAPNLRVAGYTQLDGNSQAPTAAPGTNTTQLATTAFVTGAVAPKANIASPTFTGTVGGVTAAMVGLGNVNNTSDAAKPISTAVQTALDAKSARPVETLYTTPGAGSYADPGSTCKYLDVTIVSPGGGGASGRRGAAGTIRAAGGAGAGGGYSRAMIPYSAVTFPVAVSLSAPGTGGAAVTTNDTNGNNGGASSSCTFGTYLRAGSAGGGSGGTNGAGTAATAGPGMTAGQTGAAASATGGVPGSPASFPSGPSSGGAGGGITSTDVPSAGGIGGAGMNVNNASAGVVGGATPSAGASQPTGSALPGNGGGGGAGSITAAAQDGAAGGLYGGGGGGGGASLNGNNSGAGLPGGAGIIRVVAMF